MTDEQYDAIIIGGGHNGLTCAAYLARAGKRVLVLERRHLVGGAAVTETFHPGFRNSLASYTVSLLNPKIINDLDLHAMGLRIVSRPIANFMPLDSQRYLMSGADLATTQQEFARLSPADAKRLPDYYRWLEQVADVLRDVLLRTPPNVGGGLTDIWRSGQLAWMLKKRTPEIRQAVFDLFTRSAADILDDWFENPHIKALFGFDSIVGNFSTPFAEGSGYVLLHHVFGETNGVSGAWGHAIGGMGAITQAMRKAAESAGAQVLCDAEVVRVLTLDGRASGVELRDGRAFRSRCVVANVTPKYLLTELLDENDLPAATRERVLRSKYGSGTFRMNVALDRLPTFCCKPEHGPHLSAGIIMAPTLDYMERAYSDARQFGWARQPIIEMLLPSTLDDTLAPRGKHVASLFCQHVKPQLDHADWDDERDNVAQHMINTVEQFAPGFADSVLGFEALTPKDLERRLGLTNGDIFHGALSLNQLFSARPMLGMANYRMPVKHLYLCGAGAHPGGGVTGIPGHNAAREILRDL